MQKLSRLVTLVTFGAFVLLSPLVSQAEILFQDGFESGDFSKVSGNAKWGSKNSVTVSPERAKEGAYAAKFHFAGNTSLAANADAFSELRFDVGSLRTDVWIQYELYVPANYQHRNADSSDNNKLFRLWGNTYNDIEKVGFSMWPSNGLSRAQADWDSGTGMGPKGASYGSFITAADLGKWMTIKIQAKAATATQPGTLNLWKNGVLVIDNTNTVNHYRTGETHAFRYGYLLGWSNSGFTETTDLYIDNVTFATQESDLKGTSSTTSPPAPPALRIN